MSAADSWIGVRTLGEFVFCRRAGVLSSLKAADEEEPEHVEPNVDFLPRYSVTVIEEELAVRLKRLWTRAAWTVAAFVGGVAALFFDARPLVVAAALLIFVLARFLNREFRAVLALADSRREALRAEPKEPPATLSETAPVNWWELLKAGFDSIRLHEALRDEKRKLAGKPWRVLRRGALRIPVIKLESDLYEAGRFWVYPKHEVRLAAYAHLLAVCESGEVPYGVILFGDNYDGVAVPLTAAHRAEMLGRLAAAKECISADAPILEPPPDTKICSGCPFGRPEAVAAPASKTAGGKIRGTTGHDGRLYHSECGDHFAWTPPHQLAKRKGIAPPG